MSSQLELGQFSGLSFRTSNSSFLSFWTSFWARKNPCCYECEGSALPVIGLLLWFVPWVRRILHFIRN